MTIKEILSDISNLSALLDKRYAKYLRNFNRFTNNGNRTEDIYSFTSQPLAYYSYMDEDIGVIPVMNVLASAIRTKVSKMAQTKVRTFFNPLNGTFKTIQTARNAQIFFDDFYQKQEVYKKGVEAYRDAQIFDYGILWANEETFSIENIKPWEFFCDPAEYHYGKMSRCFVKFRNYPKHYLDEKLKAAGKTPSRDRIEKTTVWIYWDLKEKRKYTFTADYQEPIEEKEIEYEMPPFSFIFYDLPVKGFSSVSLIDNSRPIQILLDLLNRKINEAVNLTPANMIIVPDGNGIKASQVDNKIGSVYTYKPTEAGGAITVVTPNFINQQYLDTLNLYEQKIYNMEGISQMSAQSKKPTGLNSGVALQTMDNIESDRFQTDIEQMIALYMDISQRVIDVFPDNADVLPARYSRATVKWKDIRKERDLISIQFSATSSLSKDPETKMAQIEKLISMQLIDPAIVSTLLEMPDLEKAYNINTASYDDCQKIIERAVNEDRYDFYEVVNMKQLMSETMNTILRLDANDEDPRVIQNLVTLLGAVKAKIDIVNEANAPPPPPPLPPPPVPQMGVPVGPDMMGGAMPLAPIEQPIM